MSWFADRSGDEQASGQRVEMTAPVEAGSAQAAGETGLKVTPNGGSLVGLAPADEESHASTSGYCHAGPVCHPPDARSGPRFSVVSHSRSRAVPVNPGTGGGSRGLGGEDAPRHAGKPPNQTAGLAADPFAAPIGVPRPPDPRRTVCPWASRSGIACGIGAGIGQVVEWLTPSGRCTQQH